MSSPAHQARAISAFIDDLGTDWGPTLSSCTPSGFGMALQSHLVMLVQYSGFLRLTLIHPSSLWPPLSPLHSEARLKRPVCSVFHFGR